MDQDPRPGLEVAVIDEPGPRGRVVDRDGGALLEAEPVGQHEGAIRGNDDLRGIAPEFGAPDDPLTDRELLDPGADLADRAGDLIADHARRLRSIRIEPQACHHIREVDT